MSNKWGVQIFSYLQNSILAEAGNQRQEEFYPNVRKRREIVPLREKAAHGVRGLIKKTHRHDY